MWCFIAHAPSLALASTSASLFRGLEIVYSSVGLSYFSVHRITLLMLDVVLQVNLNYMAHVRLFIQLVRLTVFPVTSCQLEAKSSLLSPVSYWCITHAHCAVKDGAVSNQASK